MTREPRETASQAIWTPCAQVLCAYCHNLSDQSRVRRVAVACVEQLVGPEHAFTCDGCERKVQTDNVELRDLLMLRERLRLHDGQLNLDCAMEQTGGMCMALVGTHDRPITGLKRTLVATCMDCDGGQYFIGVYDGDAWLEGDSPGEPMAYCVSLGAAFLYWLGVVADESEADA